MTKKYLWALGGIVIALAIGGSVVAIKASQFQAMGAAAENMVMPPEVVNVLEVREEIRQPRIAAVGSVMAMNGTDVSTEAEGLVRAIYFSPGTKVKQGEALLQLDIDVEQAQLRSAEAAAQSAQLALKRVQELRRSNSVSQADIDIAVSNAKQADAQVDYIRALIAKKTVRAPFDGRLGIRRISEGQFLSKGSPVVALQALDPLYIEFSVPQQKLGQLATKQLVTVTSDVYPGRIFQGAILAIDPKIDLATRNVRVQATVPNPKGELLPGMFVSLDIKVGQAKNVLLVPETAILHGSSGDAVFVIDESTKSATGETYQIVQKAVRMGARLGDFVEIIEGLKVGEKVISSGVFKLRSGSMVVIDQRLAPTFTLTPSPDNT